MRLSQYQSQPDFYDEMFENAGQVRGLYGPLAERLSTMGDAELRRRCEMADLLLRNQGVTFTVYSEDQGIEKVFPLPGTVPGARGEAGGGLRRLAARHPALRRARRGI